jgi:ABC-2 type transport system permease protein
MLRGLFKLTWIEIKVFLREPLGAVGTILFPVLFFVALSHIPGLKAASPTLPTSNYVRVSLPVLVSILIAISAVLSLVTIISIYREGGILKRLRATPLRPQTILTAHVLVKLLLSAATLSLLLLARKRYYPTGTNVPWLSFTIALLISTWSILSIGFIIASIVPTARFAQPIGAVLLYPMLGFSGIFVSIAALPPTLHAVAKFLPMTYAVSLLQGIWAGDPWATHLSDVAALAAAFAICTAISAKIFRWE